MILPVRLRFQKDAVIRIERRLPGPGKLLIRVGDAVKPDDVIGEAQVSGGFRKINLSQILSISGAEISKALLKGAGQTVYKGEPLARSKKFLGLRTQVYLSPVDGILEDVTDGEVTIRFVPAEIKLTAGFSGTIESISEGESVIVRTTVAKVRGVTGVGRERFGTFKVVGHPGEFLLPQHLDASAVGKIVIGGAIVTADTIEKALAIGVKGLVAGGINFHDTLGWSEGSDIGLTIVSLEGYGFHAIGPDIMDQIAAYDGQYGGISGERSELYIASGVEGKDKEVPAWREVKVGDTVRVVAGADLGKLGPVTKVSSDEKPLQSGLRSKLLSFKYQDGEVEAPWQNLEIVGDKK